MAATAVLSLPLEEASVKIRTGMPGDEPEDYDLDVWAGVLPVSVRFGTPEPDPKLRPEIPLPAHIHDRANSSLPDLQGNSGAPLAATEEPRGFQASDSPLAVSSSWPVPRPQ